MTANELTISEHSEQENLDVFLIMQTFFPLHPLIN